MPEGPWLLVGVLLLVVAVAALAAQGFWKASGPWVWPFALLAPAVAMALSWHLAQGPDGTAVHVAIADVALVLVLVQAGAVLSWFLLMLLLWLFATRRMPPTTGCTWGSSCASWWSSCYASCGTCGQCATACGTAAAGCAAVGAGSSLCGCASCPAACTGGTPGCGDSGSCAPGCGSGSSSGGSGGGCGCGSSSSGSGGSGCGCGSGSSGGSGGGCGCGSGSSGGSGGGCGCGSGSSGGSGGGCGCGSSSGGSGGSCCGAKAVTLAAALPPMPAPGGHLRQAWRHAAAHDLLAHHPPGPAFAADVVRVAGARLCIGCFVTYPVYAVMTAALMLSGAAPFAGQLALGLALASAQAISALGLARVKVAKLAVKAALGTGLALATHAILAAGWPDLAQAAALLGLLALAGLSTLPRARRLDRLARAG